MPSRNKPISQHDLDTAISSLRKELTELVESKITFVSVDKIKEVPAKPKKAGPFGKRKLGKRHDLRARIDKELWDRLNEYSEAYFTSNVSAALDAILWNFFDKPALSFEVETEKDENESER
jgi:hypothetical protein